MQTPDETGQIDTQMDVPRSRHGCVTTWLVFMIVVNSLVAILYFFMGDTMAAAVPSGKLTTPVLIVLGILGILNVVFSVMLFQWKKMGFWGFVVTAVLAFGVNLYLGLGIGQCVFGLTGIGILYGILQIKTDNTTTWQGLE